MTPPPTTPTNQQQSFDMLHNPQDYVSFRLTVSREEFDKITSDVFLQSHWIAYYHLGKDKKNPHFHLLLKLDDCLEEDKYNTIIEKYRQRIKRMGFSGNKYVSIKLNRNGLLHGLQYCSHEGTTPIVSHDYLLEYVQRAPKWVQKSIPVETERPSKRPRGDPDWQLTYTNLVSVAVRHARDNSLTDRSLKATVADLIARTKWRPSKWLITGGVPEFYENDYLMRLGKRKEPDMNWWTPRSI